VSGSASVGLVAGVVVDWVVGDPRRWHPVAGFGAVAAAVERRWWRPSRSAGVAYVLVLVGGVAVAAAIADRGLGRRPVARTLLLGVVTWSALGGRSLAEAGRQVGGAVRDGDPAGARRLARP
jgi:adenosylcobinamide-phosphate synthase